MVCLPLEPHGTARIYQQSQRTSLKKLGRPSADLHARTASKLRQVSLPGEL